MESRAHYADVAIDDLEAAGHRVHRCYDVGDKGFPCRGVTSPADCPLEHGVDAALVVRPRVVPQVTPLESGVTCALRAGVPVVEQGTTSLDPFAAWITRRVDDRGVAATCEDAVEDGWAGLRDRIQHRAMRVLSGNDRPGPLACAFERRGRRLAVRLSGPPLPDAAVHAVAIRVVDAVRAEGRRHQEIDVTYSPTDP